MNNKYIISIILVFTLTACSSENKAEKHKEAIKEVISDYPITNIENFCKGVDGCIDKYTLKDGSIVVDSKRRYYKKITSNGTFLTAFVERGVNNFEKCEFGKVVKVDITCSRTPFCNFNYYLENDNVIFTSDLDYITNLQGCIVSGDNFYLKYMPRLN